MEIVTSWKTLFVLAGEAGKAKMAMLETRTDDTEAAYEAAKARHDDYAAMCLKADRMIHFPDLRG